MSWGSNIKTVYITLSTQPQQIRSLMPIICNCGRIVVDWIFAAYNEPPACPYCGGNVRDAKEMEPITGFYHKIPQVYEDGVDEVTGSPKKILKRQFSQLLCNWEDEGRGKCHAGMCEWQDPLWAQLADRDRWKEDKNQNTKYPVHFSVAPQHCMLAYSYDKKSPGIFRFGNLMKQDLEKIYRDKGRLSGRDISIYKQEVSGQMKHIATPSDPSPLGIPTDSFDEDLLKQMIQAMKEREEPPEADRIAMYLRGEVVSLSGQRVEMQKMAMPGAEALNIGPVALDPSKPMVGVKPTQPQLPASATPVDAGSTAESAGVIIPFGKHKGKNLGQIQQEDAPYLAWVSKNMAADHPDIAAAATILVGSGQPASPAPTQPAEPASPAPAQAPAQEPATAAAPEAESQPSAPQEPEAPAADPSGDGTALPDDIKEACKKILNENPKFKDNAVLQATLDKHGEGLAPFEKYQVDKWDGARLTALYNEIKG